MPTMKTVTKELRYPRSPIHPLAFLPAPTAEINQKHTYIQVVDLSAHAKKKNIKVSQCSKTSDLSVSHRKKTSLYLQVSFLTMQASLTVSTLPIPPSFATSL